ncbi:hypothetical protein CU097_002606, partial [Rhizopus azygosporus]
MQSAPKIPITRLMEGPFKKDEVLKEGLVLCTRIEQWYAKRHNGVKDIELRKTRMRWRRFYAVLRPDRLELYHAATSIRRLAHIIYLLADPPLRPVRLSLVSPWDYIWRLEYKCKHLVAYHFQCCQPSEAKEWYMFIYHRISNHQPHTTCKKPIPLYVDVDVRLDEKQPSDVLIRIPLDYFREAMYKQHHVEQNMCLRDVKSTLINLLYFDKVIPFKDSVSKEWKLFWTIGNYVEEVDEADYLIGCQLIEQSHRLELRLQQKYTKKQVIYEGLLVHKEDGVCYYTILYGNQLFFLDAYYYTNTTTQKNWFSATTNLILKNTHLLRKKKYIKQLNMSAPQLASLSYTSPPDPAKLVNTKMVIELKNIKSIELCDASNTFAVHHKNTTLYYQAPNTQALLEWMMLINCRLRQINNKEVYHFEYMDQIIHSGKLYVKKDYSRHYQPQYCILVKSVNFGGALILFDMVKRSKFCKSGGESLPIYEKKRALIRLEDSYVYTGDECILDQLIKPDRLQEFDRYYPDGVITGSDRASDCVFIIWQVAKRHFISSFREHVSILKLGHHLGTK